MIFLLFFTVYITLMTHFIVSVLWLCLVVHMWVEVTFDIFTTVMPGDGGRACFVHRTARRLPVPGDGHCFDSRTERATHIAVMLFVVTAVIGFGVEDGQRCRCPALFRI